MIVSPSSKQASKSLDLKQLFIHQLNRVNCTKGYLIRNLPLLIEMASFKTMQLAIQEDLDDVKNNSDALMKCMSFLAQSHQMKAVK